MFLLIVLFIQFWPILWYFYCLFIYRLATNQRQINYAIKHIQTHRLLFNLIKENRMNELISEILHLELGD